MVDKLQLEPTKCKRERHSRSCRRLVGFLKFRISKSSKPWVRVRLEEFCSLAGVTMRTARRCINIIRDDEESEIVLRTCHEDRRWVLYASTTNRLQGLSRSEPFEVREDGRKRIVKDKKSGRTIKQEQLILNADPVMWKAKPNDCLEDQEEDQEVLKEHENQDTFDFNQVQDQELRNAWSRFLGKPIKTEPRVSDILRCEYIGGFSPRENKDKHRKSKFGEKSLNRLAFWITRNELEPLHYDNCKIAVDRPIAWKFTKDALVAGYDRRDIVKSWDDALHDCHGMAVDMDPTAPAGTWRASSTSCRARKLLQSCKMRYQRVSSKDDE